MTPYVSKRLAQMLSIMLESHTSNSSRDYIQGTREQGYITVLDTQRVIDTLNRNADEEIKKLN